MPEEYSELVGVYGTFKRGQERNSLFTHGWKKWGIGPNAGQFVGNSHAPGHLLDLGPYPILIEAPETLKFRTGSRVSVELYRIPKSVLDAMDEVEGHPHFYDRRLCNSGIFGSFWVYYGKTKDYLKGKRKYCIEDKWDGMGISKTILLDFGDGTLRLPKCRLEDARVLGIQEAKDMAAAIISPNGTVDPLFINIPDQEKEEPTNTTITVVPSKELELGQQPVIKTL